MPEKSIVLRLGVRDSNRAIAALRAVGQQGEKALNRVERAARNATTKGLLLLDKGASKARQTFTGLASGLALIPGPLGNITSRVGFLSSGLGAAGAAGVAFGAAIVGATAALWAAGKAGAQAERQIFRIEGVLRATGNAAGVMSSEIQQFAYDLDAATLASAEGVREAAAVLLTFRSVGREVFFETLTLSQDLAAVLGTDLNSAVLQLGKALQDPATGLTALNRSGVTFSETMKEQIKTLDASGRKLEAQKLILAEVARQVGGSGSAEASGVIGAVDGLALSWGRMLENVGRTGVVTGLAEDALGALMWTVESFDRGLQFLGVSETLDQQLARQDPAARRYAEDQAAQGLARQRAQERADAILTIENKLEEERLALRENTLERLNNEEAEAIAKLEALRASETGEQVDELIARTQALFETRRQAFADSQTKTATQIDQNAKLIDQLQFKIELEGMSAREQSVESAVRRLSADATAAQIAQVRELAGTLFDEKEAATQAAEAEKARTKVMEEGKSLAESLRRPLEVYRDELTKINELLEQGAISEETAARARENAARALDDSNELLQTLREVGEETAGAVSDAIRGFVFEGETMADTIRNIDQALLDLGFRLLVTEPLARLFADAMGSLGNPASGGSGGGFGGIFGSSPDGGSIFGSFFDGGGLLGALFHKGGVVGKTAGSTREVPGVVFKGAPRFHNGASDIGLRPNEVPAILERGETVIPAGQSPMQNVNLTFNVADRESAETIKRSKGQIAGDVARSVQRARRWT